MTETDVSLETAAFRCYGLLTRIAQLLYLVVKNVKKRAEKRERERHIKKFKKGLR